MIARTLAARGSLLGSAERRRLSGVVAVVSPTVFDRRHGRWRRLQICCFGRFLLGINYPSLIGADKTLSPVIKRNVATCTLPESKQRYSILNNTKVSHDSNILTVGFEGRDYLGWDSSTPTCISVSSEHAKSKSYSPITHPSNENSFELLVKSYPLRTGGGVGAYLCNLQAGDVFEAKVKSQRIIHSSSEVVGRWSNVGLIAGGTGIAPLYQILRMMLRADDTTKIFVLSINRYEEDILLKAEMDKLALQYPDRIAFTYSLTGENKSGYQSGRGNVEMALKALPDPSLDDVMIFVCGKDGFVESWGGKVEREKTIDGSKGKKIQGPLLGILKESGFCESQVFKY